MKRYESYKPSGIDWIGEIPSHWQVVPLKRHLSEPLKYGANEPAESENKDYPRYIRITDIDNNGNLKDDTFKSLEPQKSEEYLLKKGDILFARSGATVGKTYLFNENYNACFAGYLIRATCDALLSPDFLYYYTCSGEYNNWKNSIFIQATIQNIGADKYNLLPVPIPPFIEQEAIASWLDKKCGEIDAAIAKVDREIELIEELKQSEISRVVTRGLNPDAPLRPSGIDWIGEIPEHWKVCRIKDCFHLKTGNTPKGFDKPINDEEINWFTPSDIESSGTILTTAERKLSKELIDQEGITLFPKKSLIFVGIGATAGKLGYAEIEGYSNQQITALIPKNIFSKYYFYYLCQDTKRIRENASYTTLPIINNSYLSQIYWLLPPLTEQKSIADYLDKKCAKIDGLKAKLTKKRETLKELRQAIISEVVTGKRKVI